MKYLERFVDVMFALLLTFNVLDLFHVIEMSRKFDREFVDIVLIILLIQRFADRHLKRIKREKENL